MLAGMEMSTRRGPGRLAIVIAAAVVAAATLIDIEVAQGLPRSNEVRLIADIVVGGAAVTAIAGILPLLMVATGSAASLTVSVFMAIIPGDPPLFGAAELGGLLAMAVVGVRQARTGRQLARVAAFVGVAVVGGGLLRVTPGFGLAADLAYLGSSVIVAVGVGWWWRSLNLSRLRAEEAFRQDERLELARELHDVVAHHVTGIVVQLQALRQVAGDQPERVVGALPMLEATATRSLEAMRQMVWALRATEPDPLPTRTADLADDVNRIVTATGVPTRMELTIANDADVPDAVALAVERVVREALTNVARHTPTGTEAQVTVEVDHRAATVHVIDNGDNAAPGIVSFASGAGFGLTGLAERIALHRGEFRAAPIPGGGWAVTATIPIDRG